MVVECIHVVGMALPPYYKDLFTPELPSSKFMYLSGELSVMLDHWVIIRLAMVGHAPPYFLWLAHKNLKKYVLLVYFAYNF